MDQVGQVHGQTTTRTTITETHVQTNVRFDPSYVKTIPGGLKVAALVLDIIVFICGVCSSIYWRSTSVMEWSYFVSMTAFWVTLILIGLYLFHFIEKFHVVPWALLEMCFCGAWAFFFLTLGISCATYAGQYTQTNALAALSFFAFLATIVYGADAFLKFMGWRSGQFVQGERIVRQTETTTRS